MVIGTPAVGRQQRSCFGAAKLFLRRNFGSWPGAISFARFNQDGGHHSRKPAPRVQSEDQADSGRAPGERPVPSRVNKAALGNPHERHRWSIRPSLSRCCQVLLARPSPLGGSRFPRAHLRFVRSASDRPPEQWATGRLGKASSWRRAGGFSRHSSPLASSTPTLLVEAGCPGRAAPGPPG